MKVCIIGSGSIAYSSALSLIRDNQDIDLTLIGDHSPFGASQAAGAMLNILSEVDWFNSKTELMKWKLIHRLKPLAFWNSFAEGLGNSHNPSCKKMINYGEGTLIKIAKNGSNKVERASYNSMCEAAEAFSCSVAKNEDDEFEYLSILDEPSVDSSIFLGICKSLLSEKAHIIDKTVKSLRRNSKKWSVLTSDHENLEFDTVIICAGSWSGQLIENCDDVLSPNIKVYNDVGNAFLIKSEFSHISSPSVDRIIRTPNRGGTCGIHAVQRLSSVYIGASSHPTHESPTNPFTDSIAALTTGFSEVVGFSSLNLTLKPLIGYRPVTEDTLPIIGALEDNLFCCYGTKRDGFTWSLYYGNLISDLVNSHSLSVDQEELLKMSNPRRKFVSVAPPKFCIDSYVESKEAEAYQHNYSPTKDEVNQTRVFAETVHDELERHLGYPAGIHPDLIKLVAYKRSLATL